MRLRRSKPRTAGRGRGKAADSLRGESLRYPLGGADDWKRISSEGHFRVCCTGVAAQMRLVFKGTTMGTLVSRPEERRLEVNPEDV